jgi:hypothetical protein
MIPINTNNRILELYSSKRNRNLYPNPSAFEVQFAPSMQQTHCGEKIIQDPVCKGAIYYTFDWTPQNESPSYVDWVSIYAGFCQPGTTKSDIILELDNITQQQYVDPSFKPNFPDFFVGFKIYATDVDQNLTEYRFITSWNPSTGLITVNRPFTQNISAGSYMVLFTILPQTWSIVIPTLDLYNMVVNKTQLYYNGYYVVFESPNKNYSNSTNSNIFSRRITYYDSKTQVAYFDQPLPFNYLDDPPIENQVWTLRKDLPLERWTLTKKTYYKTTKPINPLIGPLQGYVVVLPDEASSIDNYYKGKYIYSSSNVPQVYSPPLPPQTNISPISGSFYPIYGLFYIRAYNGTTKEASIEPIVNKKNLSDQYNITNDSEIPTGLPLDLNTGDFIPIINCLSIQNMGGGVYRPIYNESFPPIGTRYRITIGLPIERGFTYNISLSARISQTLKDQIILPFDTYIVAGTDSTGSPIFFSEDVSVLTTDFQTYNFTITVAADADILRFRLIFRNTDPLLLPDCWFEFKDLKVTQISIINIVELNYDNFSPLDYNGTMVSTNEVVCYEMQIVSVTLPNRGLLTGSIIAFYPFVYVQIENATSPSRVATNIIISNNPPSNKAIFTVYVPQVNNPEDQKFVTLIGGDRQIVKFKPNDNLRFSVYLPDGTPFQTLLPDTLSPYPPDPSLQVHAVFSLSRVSNENS